MGEPDRRFVAKAEAGQGWRIWDRTQKKWWGQPCIQYPEQLLEELNGGKRPDELIRLVRQTPRKHP
ncbi:MAG: hypothetical protein ACO1SX_07415 [Actinomycetota bacterium]